jgi:hypothetical protein
MTQRQARFLGAPAQRDEGPDDRLSVESLVVDGLEVVILDCQGRG